MVLMHFYNALDSGNAPNLDAPVIDLMDANF
jgi:hypothetical protein